MSSILTLVAARAATTLTPSLIGRVRDAVAGRAAIVLSPGEAADIPCQTPADLAAARAALEGAAVDLLLSRARGRRKGLLLADMDSTIVTTETLDELAATAGLQTQISAITRRSMNGEIEFAAALRERVAMLRGLPASALEATWQQTQLTPGARTLVATMRAHNALTALVSGGFTWFSERVAARCGFDRHFANALVIAGDALTGAVVEPILDRSAKLERLRALISERRLRPAASLAVGDGANDLDMIGEAGLGVAYHPKPIVAAAALNRVDHADLRALLFAQGYPASAFREE